MSVRNFCFLFLSLASQAYALPGDYDMYRQQSLKANEVSRAPMAGTVARGHKPFIYKTVEEAQDKLVNSEPRTKNSVWRGQRLFNSNCQTCHGISGDGKGPVGPLLAVPNLLTDFYSSTPDGRIFSVLTLGLRNMPRYGYKFSEREKWDLVNYVRFLQKKFEVSEPSLSINSRPAVTQAESK